MELHNLKNYLCNRTITAMMLRGVIIFKTVTMEGWMAMAAVA